MKRFYFFLFLILTAPAVFGQSATVTLTGTLAMATGEEFPYKIVATDSNGALYGYAFTYNEPEQTKVIIKGKIDKERKKVSFREVEIVASHGVQTKAFMCLIHAQLEMRQGKLSGPVSSMESDNTACTPGTLTFAGNDELNDLFSSHNKYDMAVTMGGKKETPRPRADQPEPAQMPVQPVTDKVTAGVGKSYDWHTDSLVIDIWDGGNVDGDVVTLEFDGSPVLKRFMIDKPKKHLKVAVNGDGAHTLAIIAENEGSDPPNTATLTLTDGDRKYSVVAYNNKGQQSIITIKRVKN